MNVKLKSMRLICAGCRTRTKGVRLDITAGGIRMRIPLCEECLKKAASKELKFI